MVREEEKQSWEDVGKEVGEEDDDTLRFTPIDSRHLTQLDILRQRIVKLLNHSKDEVVPYTNIAIRIVSLPRRMVFCVAEYGHSRAFNHGTGPIEDSFCLG